MILTYIDESGDTGTNFHDEQQPIFVLGAILINESAWQKLEQAFIKVIKTHFNGIVPNDFELHTMHLIGRKKHFKDFSIEETKLFRNDVINLIEKFKLPVFYRKIIKRNYDRYCQKQYGKGIKIAPYIMALPFISLAVDHYLEKENERGVLIFDEHKDLVDIEKSLKTLRLDLNSSLTTANIIEKGFFIKSEKSYAIQLIDFIIYYIRKYEEGKWGKKVSEIHQEVFPQIERITISLDKHDQSIDILEWVKNQEDKK